MASTYRITRDLTADEIPWYPQGIPAGTEVTRFTGCTYGCVNEQHGTAVTLVKGGPFLEVPTDSLEEL